MRGVRTRFSDDLLWLPYTVCDYLEATGDSTLLHHPVSFCAGEPLEESEQERLKKLQSLYDQRLITAEEYEEKRKEILKEL